MLHLSAFRSPIRSHAVYDIAPPRVRRSVQATAGCQHLYKSISEHADTNPRTQNKDASHRNKTCYTDSDGVFCPHEDMALLASRYQYVSVVGAGQSAVIIRVQDTFHDNTDLAVKVLHLHYTQLGAQEADCLRCLTQADPGRMSGTLRLHTTFTFADHYCLVFDYLDPRSLLKYSLHTLPPAKSLSVVRQVSLQLLRSLGFLYRQNIIHGDLKPENILLSKAGDLSSLQLVDFGNAIRCVHEELSLYYDNFAFQTLLYRAPEVVFGLPFGLEVDMWSLGCVLAELYTGKPLFFAASTEKLLDKMVSLLGPLPTSLYQRGKYSAQLKKYTQQQPQPDATLKIMKTLGIGDFNFAHFLAGCLRYDPAERQKVWQAAQTPFISSYCGLKFLLPPNSKGCGQDAGVIDREAYTLRPLVANPAADHMTSCEVLRHGTRRGEEEGGHEAAVGPANRITSPWGGKHVFRKVAQVVPVQRKTPELLQKDTQIPSLLSTRSPQQQQTSEPAYIMSQQTALTQLPQQQGASSETNTTLLLANETAHSNSLNRSTSPRPPSQQYQESSSPVGTHSQRTSLFRTISPLNQQDFPISQVTEGGVVRSSPLYHPSLQQQSFRNSATLDASPISQVPHGHTQMVENTDRSSVVPSPPDSLEFTEQQLEDTGEFSEDDPEDDAHFEGLMAHTLRLLGRQDTTQAVSSPNTATRARHPSADIITKANDTGADTGIPPKNIGAKTSTLTRHTGASRQLVMPDEVVGLHPNVKTSAPTNSDPKTAYPDERHRTVAAEEMLWSNHRRGCPTTSPKTQHMGFSAHQKQRDQSTVAALVKVSDRSLMSTGISTGSDHSDKANASLLRSNEVIVVSDSSNSSEDKEAVVPTATDVSKGHSKASIVREDRIPLNETFTVAEDSCVNILEGINNGKSSIGEARKRSSHHGLNLDVTQGTPSKVPHYKSKSPQAKQTQVTESSHLTSTNISTAEPPQDPTSVGTASRVCKPQDSSQAVQSVCTPGKARRVPVTKSQETCHFGLFRRGQAGQATCFTPVKLNQTCQASSFTPLRQNQMGQAVTCEASSLTNQMKSVASVASPQTPCVRMLGKASRTPVTTPATSGRCSRVETPREQKSKPGRVPLVTATHRQLAGDRILTPQGTRPWGRDRENLLASPALCRSVGKPGRVKVTDRTTANQKTAGRVRREGGRGAEDVTSMDEVLLL